MLGFVIQVILVSIVVSIAADVLKLIPRYPRLRHRLLVQVIDTVLLTAALSALLAAGIYPSWWHLALLMLTCLWVAVRCTSAIARRQQKGAEMPGQGPRP